MRATRLRPNAYVNVLDVCTRNAKRHDVLRLARGRACVATDAARLVYDFGPLRRLRLLVHQSLSVDKRRVTFLAHARPNATLVFVLG
jgi:hypothetical protein